MRELLVIVFFVALCVASLRTGGWLASITLAIASIFVMGVLIVAFVGASIPKAFSIGFLLPVVAYGSSVMVSGAREFDPYASQLPASTLLLNAHHVLVSKTYIDSSSGKQIENYDPIKNGPVIGMGLFGGSMGMGGGGMGGMAGMGGMGGFAGVLLTESPDRQTFMTIGHSLIAMMLGWLGGKFAVYVHRTQRRDTSNLRTSHDR